MTEAEIGSAGAEALKLLRALGATSTPTDDPAAPETHRCSTSWCPVCQAADFVRENPEAIAGVVASAGSMLGALRELIDAAAHPKDRS